MLREYIGTVRIVLYINSLAKILSDFIIESNRSIEANENFTALEEN